ncbi:MAG: MBL fold metallo-hydrolase [Gammaproteobacteria bacterium]|nr:MBL fold metallo-hydrolase [Gammaproteobacteria bacterium]NND55109.1 MBL fold metallo-hydrolase [Gammaproteobacteria bacterium]
MNDTPVNADSLTVGVVTPIAPEVCRLLAPNGGPLTGPGTNTYLLGAGHSVVIDPGPAIAEHIDAMLAAVGDALTYIVVTHTHLDHSPAAALLAAETGAQLVGLAPPASERQDQSFVPDLMPVDGEVLRLDDVELRAIHTPGHASNHVCYWSESAQLLFTGDHVMQGSTVVIPPPDGDMQQYLDSLEKIRALAPAAIAPGHGTVIDEPDRAVRRLIRHRLQREARVFDRLQRLGEADLDALLPHAYADIDVRMLPVAAYSMHAHLIKLEADGRVVCREGVWSVSDG